ncbi:hypothetical protein [Devriesea agamarum]|uniref:hypothetical protein n=1 Tax=Devriesea agamarum TaxID=472569 RepID=UPI00071E4811|nr:hypothetical protein [Devriesea agamarum]
MGSAATTGAHRDRTRSLPKITAKLATRPEVFGDQLAVDPCRDKAVPTADPGTVTGNILGDQARQAYLDAGLPESAANRMHWATSIKEGSPAEVCTAQVGVGFRVTAGMTPDVYPAHGKELMTDVTLSVTGPATPPMVNMDRPILSMYDGMDHRSIPLGKPEFRASASKTAHGVEHTYVWTVSIPSKQLSDPQQIVLRTDTGFLPEQFNVFTFYDVQSTEL